MAKFGSSLRLLRLLSVLGVLSADDSIAPSKVFK